MDIDRDALFGCLAVQAGKVTAVHVAETSAEVARTSNTSLADLLVKKGLISELDRTELDRQVQDQLAAPEFAPGETRDFAPPSTPESGTLEDVQTDHPVETIDLGLPAAVPPGSEVQTIDRLSETIDSSFVGRAFGSSASSPSGSVPPQFAKTIDGDSAHTIAAGAPPDRATSIYQRENRSRYSFTRVQGEGGLGQVWLATDLTLNRQIAIKSIRPGREDSQTRWRLIREAQITGQLEHPNIIPIYELQQSDEFGQPYYTMRFLRGKTLEDEIRRYQKHRKQGTIDPLELPRLLNICIDICNAIAYAGSHGVIHRDLKPQNVMLGDFGEVIVLDWGLAKQFGEADRDHRPVSVTEVDDSQRTIQGRIVGSPAFMAPEQARGEHDLADHRTDVYGLGAILFNVLTGKAPHRGEKSGNSGRDTLNLLDRISKGETPRTRGIDPSIPIALDAICAHAMAQKQSDRYQNAGDLARDLQRWLADEPVSVYTEPWRQQLARWFRRHRVWAQSIGTALLILSLGLTIATVLVESARRRERAARETTQLALDAEQEALAEARLAKAEATRRFRQARRAVDQSFTGISDGLLNYPGVQELRTRLLRDAAAHYEEFVEERTDDPELRIEFAMALLRLGDVHRLLAEFDASREAYERAQIVFDELRTIDSEREEVEFASIQGQIKLGLLYVTVATMPDTVDALSSHQQAEKAYNSANDGLQKLLSQEPQRVDYRRLEAQLLANRGVLLSRMSRFDEATEAYSQASQRFASLAEKTQLNQDKEELAKVQISFGELLLQTAETDKALTELRQAIQVYEQLVASDENEPRYLQGLADARLTLANTMQTMGQSSESAPLYLASIDDYVALVRSRPDVPAYHAHLATAHLDLAQVLSRLGQNEEAKQHAEVGLSITMDLVDGNSDTVEYFVREVYALLTLGQVLRELNELALAETAFYKGLEKTETLLNHFPDDPHYYRLRGQSYNGLGILKMLSQDGDAAQQSLADAQSDFEKAIQLAPEDDFSHDGLAWARTYLGDALRQLGRSDEANSFYRLALEERESRQLSDEHQYRLASLLLLCPDDTIRDASRGLDIATKLSDEHSTRSEYLELKAIALFRQQMWSDCLEQLDRAEVVQISHNSTIEFWRAMALWRLENKGEARSAIDRAIANMDKHAPGNYKLWTVRRDAEALITGDATKNTGPATQ